MDTKTFNGYLKEAKKYFDLSGIKPTETEIYEYALQKIKEKYDQCIENEVSKYRRNIRTYADNLFENLKKEIRNELNNDSKI